MPGSRSSEKEGRQAVSLTTIVFLLPHSWLLIARGFSTKRVSMGLWLLRLTVKILANLRLTVSMFPLWSPESFLKVFNFFDE